VVDSDSREVLDDVVDHSVLSRHTRYTTRGRLGFTPLENAVAMNHTLLLIVLLAGPIDRESCRL
jgi:hypothetical protein